MSSKTTIVIGSGFAGLSAACYLARGGADVLVLEKQSAPGGRASQLKADGFTFDMGPSWYWMPDVFDRFFASFGKKTSDYYHITRLDPSYRVYWSDGETDLPANLKELKTLFESLEPGSSIKLDQFLNEAAYKYKVGMQKLVYKPGRSLLEFADWQVIRGAFQLDLLTSMENHVNRFFTHPRIREILKFPVLFLGALPKDTPALYSLMNYADIVGGTWYPDGGMYSIVQAMYKLATELGVRFRFNEPVNEITIEANAVHEVITSKNVYYADAVIGSADYHHIETSLLPASHQSYSAAYWDSRKLAPSCLLYYVGLNRKVPGLQHHTLFFDTDFEKHAEQIYTNPAWPTDPLFYVCASSVTDPAAAPEGGENLFFLVPVAAGMKDDTDELRDKYFEMIWARFQKRVTDAAIENGSPESQELRSSIVYKKSFGVSDFLSVYNSFKGNAYGLANTLKQTAILKPSCKSKKVSNLFYAGQLTVPGPGVPPSLVSGEVVAEEVLKYLLKFSKA